MGSSVICLCCSSPCSRGLGMLLYVDHRFEVSHRNKITGAEYWRKIELLDIRLDPLPFLVMFKGLIGLETFYVSIFFNSNVFMNKTTSVCGCPRLS